MKPSISGSIWDQLTPTQRASLFFVAEVDVSEILGAYEDTAEDELHRTEALRRAGITDGISWWLPRGPALMKKGLVKTAPYYGGTSSTQIVLTPLGRRVVEHGKKLLREPKKTAAQLNAEIEAALASQPKRHGMTRDEIQTSIEQLRTEIAQLRQGQDSTEKRDRRQELIVRLEDRRADLADLNREQRSTRA